MNESPTKHELESLAKAEKFLNRVLAYQAAIAVHQLKEELDLEVQELSLSVIPRSVETVGTYRVVCTVKHANVSKKISLEFVIEPEKAITNSVTRLAD